jgi:predicted O-methyltransferase YrrM
MNEYYQYFKETLNTQLSRDAIYIDVLSVFDKKPINIFEIGCARDLNKNSRFGDGWSSLFWADYVHLYGGQITSCDISPASLENNKILLSDFIAQIKINFILRDGSEILEENNEFDLILLDGSDDPNQMVEQINLCNLNRSYVLCDDFHTKGALLKIHKPKHILYRLKNGHEMALFHNSIKEFQVKEI